MKKVLMVLSISLFLFSCDNYNEVKVFHENGQLSERFFANGEDDQWTWLSKLSYIKW